MVADPPPPPAEEEVCEKEEGCFKAHPHQTLRSADSAVDGCTATQRQKISYLCVDAVHCGICSSVNEPLTS